MIVIPFSEENEDWLRTLVRDQEPDDDDAAEMEEPAAVDDSEDR